jgi:putative ABC transport system permease protein
MLATAGIYALMSFSLTRRTREIGIRMALGASPRRILRSIFGRTFAQVALGVLIGSIPGSALLAFGMADAGRGSLWLMVPGSIASAVFVLLIAAAACVPPARRALDIDPTEALRAEG